MGWVDSSGGLAWDESWVSSEFARGARSQEPGARSFLFIRGRASCSDRFFLLVESKIGCFLDFACVRNALTQVQNA